MIDTVIPRVAPMVMTTATVSWKEAMAPTMYDKLKVTTNCVGVGGDKYIVHSYDCFTTQTASNGRYCVVLVSLQQCVVHPIKNLRIITQEDSILTNR